MRAAIEEARTGETEGGIPIGTALADVLEYVKGLWGDKVADRLELEKRKSQAVVSETDPYPER